MFQKLAVPGNLQRQFAVTSGTALSHPHDLRYGGDICGRISSSAGLLESWTGCSIRRRMIIAVRRTSKSTLHPFADFSKIKSLIPGKQVWVFVAGSQTRRGTGLRFLIFCFPIDARSRGNFDCRVLLFLHQLPSASASFPIWSGPHYAWTATIVRGWLCRAFAPQERRCLPPPSLPRKISAFYAFDIFFLAWARRTPSDSSPRWTRRDASLLLSGTRLLTSSRPFRRAKRETEFVVICHGPFLSFLKQFRILQSKYCPATAPDRPTHICWSFRASSLIESSVELEPVRRKWLAVEPFVLPVRPFMLALTPSAKLSHEHYRVQTRLCLTDLPLLWPTFRFRHWALSTIAEMSAFPLINLLFFILKPWLSIGTFNWLCALQGYPGLPLLYPY